MTVEDKRYLAHDMAIPRPLYRCKNGHELDYTITRDYSAETPQHVCAGCYFDWMLSMGWEAKRD